MSKLEQLIEQLCPDGVEFKTLGELGRFYGGLTGKKKDDFKDGNATFITYMNVYKNPKLKLDVIDTVKICENESQNTIQYGDILFTGSSETPDECGMSSVLTTKTDKKIYLNSFCFGFRFHDLSVFNVDFLSHLFRSDNLRYQIGRTASGVTRFNVSKERMKDVIIPVPPLDIQREIVRILDSFTELTAELTVEKSFRDKQYRYYSTLLFDKAKKTKDTYKIGDICSIEKGKTPIQKSVPGKYPLVVTTSERKTCCDFQFDSPSVCIPLVSSRGHGVASLNHVYYQEGKFALGNILCAITPISNQLILPKYLYYYFEQTKDYTLVPLMKGGANVSLHLDDIARIKVPVPSIDEQSFIVDLLQRFELYTNESLSLEITTRQKQYEYYRDKLLTFKRKGD